MNTENIPTAQNDEAVNKSEAERTMLPLDEWKAKKLEERKAVFAMANDAAAKAVASPENFRAFLNLQAHFNRYSATNALLIFAQNSDANRLKTYEEWAKANVTVKKTAKSIAILEPRAYTKEDGTESIAYNVKKVFDVSRTVNGRRIPPPTANENPAELTEIMLKTAPTDVRIVDELPDERMKGMAAYYNNDEQTLYAVKETDNSVSRFQHIALELAHAELACNSSNSYSRAAMSFPAYCAAYMLCRKYGIDTESFHFSRLPDDFTNKTPKAIRSELSKINTAFNGINSRIYSELFKQREQNKQQEQKKSRKNPER